jgi:hypothetical protein
MELLKILNLVDNFFNKLVKTNCAFFNTSNLTNALTQKLYKNLLYNDDNVKNFINNLSITTYNLDYLYADDLIGSNEFNESNGTNKICQLEIYNMSKILNVSEEEIDILMGNILIITLHFLLDINEHDIDLIKLCVENKISSYEILIILLINNSFDLKTFCYSAGIDKNFYKKIKSLKKSSAFTRICKNF